MERTVFTRNPSSRGRNSQIAVPSAPGACRNQSNVAESGVAKPEDLIAKATVHSATFVEQEKKEFEERSKQLEVEIAQPKPLINPLVTHCKSKFPLSMPSRRCQIPFFKNFNANKTIRTVTCAMLWKFWKHLNHCTKGNFGGPTRGCFKFFRCGGDTGSYQQIDFNVGCN